MRVTILDDWFDTLRTLPCFEKLAGHDVTVFTDHVEGTDVLARRLQETQALVLIRERTRGPRRAPRTAAAAAPDQPAQRVPPHRRRRLHVPRHRRELRPARRHPVLCRRRAHVGAGARGRAPAAPAGGVPARRALAGRRGADTARKDPGDLRLRSHRRRRRRLRPGVRDGRPGLVPARVARAGPSGRRHPGAGPRRALLGQRRALAAPAAGARHQGDRDGVRSGDHAPRLAPREHEPGRAHRARELWSPHCGPAVRAGPPSTSTRPSRSSTGRTRC